MTLPQFRTITTWNITLNKTLLYPPLFVKKGSLVYLTLNTTGRVSLKSSSQKTIYTEFSVASNNRLSKLNNTRDVAFDIQLMIDAYYFRTSFKIVRFIEPVGVYNLTITNTGSGLSTSKTLKITNCNLPCF